MFSREKKFNLLVVNGPNLNLLGEREPDVYGRMTLKQLNAEIKSFCKSKDIRVRFFQSNHEGEIVDCIHRFRECADGIVINPGALTHYSYSLRDAIAAVSVPTVEVHLSDIHQREAFRKVSVIQPVCIKQISGKGKNGYLEAIGVLMEL
jgi:3-dehydroquinate dehydratase type II